MRVALARLVARGLVERDGPGPLSPRRRRAADLAAGRRAGRAPTSARCAGTAAGSARSRRAATARHAAVTRAPSPSSASRGSRRACGSDPTICAAASRRRATRCTSSGSTAHVAVLRLSELDPKTDARARAPLGRRVTSSRASARRARRSSAAPRGSSDSAREAAMVETFLVGGRAIREIALDPCLPDAIAPEAERRALVAAMREYDRAGRACWREFMRGTRRAAPIRAREPRGPSSEAGARAWGAHQSSPRPGKPGTGATRCRSRSGASCSRSTTCTAGCRSRCNWALVFAAFALVACGARTPEDPGLRARAVRDRRAPARLRDPDARGRAPLAVRHALAERLGRQLARAPTRCGPRSSRTAATTWSTTRRPARRATPTSGSSRPSRSRATSFRRKVIRDLSGQTGLKQAKAVFLRDVGWGAGRNQRDQGMSRGERPDVGWRKLAAGRAHERGAARHPDACGSPGAVPARGSSPGSRPTGSSPASARSPSTRSPPTRTTR